MVFAAVLIICVFTNDLHQQVFRFYLKPPYSDNSYGYGFIFLIIQIWIIFCLSAMDVILVSRSKTSGKKRFWLPVIPGIVLLGWNIGNILRLPFLSAIAGDLTAFCCLCIAAIFQGCILCGLIPTNSRYFELFQSTGNLDVVNSIFFRVTQIEEKLQISVHVVCLADIRDFLAERPDLLIQQEEQEWFIRCPVS